MPKKVPSEWRGVRLSSTEAGDASLEPHDFHVEPADPLMVIALKGAAVVVVRAATDTEEGLDDFEEPRLPLALWKGWT
jgi:hypothetical protein